MEESELLADAFAAVTWEKDDNGNYVKDKSGLRNGKYFFDMDKLHPKEHPIIKVYAKQGKYCHYATGQINAFHYGKEQYLETDTPEQLLEKCTRMVEMYKEKARLLRSDLENFDIIYNNYKQTIQKAEKELEQAASSFVTYHIIKDRVSNLALRFQ